MKNIFKTFISCIVLAVGVSSCYDEMDSKSSIDAQYDQASNITASLGKVQFYLFLKFPSTEASVVQREC